MTDSELPPEETPSADAGADAATSLPGGAGGSYEVIARRYRPRQFHEVVGQEAIAETLSQAMSQGRLGHAYLFCGPRGVGKTSMARIFARALQCPNSKDGVPCDTCGVCDRIFRGEDLDVVEMDGASHRGIDDVRELIQHVRYAPTEGAYRIFIIDEVHMLTREAFNSLLKTLEEPPSHVKFIFATTEPEKVLPTVLSRCQRFDFSPISPDDIVRRLSQICEMEGATPEEGLLESIASLARGGMRDSQSLLDQLLSFAGASPTSRDLDSITGRLAPEEVEALVDRIDGGDRAGVVTELIRVGAGGTDPAVLLEQVIESLRSRLHTGVTEGWGEVEIDRNLLGQEILQEARARIRRLGRADLVLELALLRLSTLGDLVPISRWTDLLASEGAPASSAATAEVRRRPSPRETPQKTMEPPRRTPQSPEPPQPPAPSASSRPTIAEAPAAPSVPPTAPAPAPAEPAPTAAAPEPTQPRAAEPEESSNSSGLAALRRAVESTDAARPRASREPERTEAPRIDASNPQVAVREALSRVSGSVQRLVGDQFRIDTGAKPVALTLPESAISMLGERQDELRRELVSAFGSAVAIEAGAFESAEAEETPEPTETAVPLAEAEVPPIVEKACEIFRGELFRGAPPRRS